LVVGGVWWLGGGVCWVIWGWVMWFGLLCWVLCVCLCFWWLGGGVGFGFWWCGVVEWFCVGLGWFV
ncbi:hypothetical protein RA272_29450, partial [Pseudomonas syringae pv. tagetis]|uniref:hypothetical protein n=1 Tax=Pseudomonas syringae group genomosp. 7 TaxID=251699 RepID=UPI00376FAC78